MQPGHHRRDDLAAALLQPGPLPDTVVEHLRAGLRAWMLASEGLPLPVTLGLPSTPARARRAARNHHLRQAARHLPAADPWQTAEALADEVRRFNRRLWPAWCVQQAAPCYATPLESALFAARQAGDCALPESPQALADVLA